MSAWHSISAPCYGTSHWYPWPEEPTKTFRWALQGLPLWSKQISLDNTRIQERQEKCLSSRLIKCALAWSYMPPSFNKRQRHSIPKSHLTYCWSPSHCCHPCHINVVSFQLVKFFANPTWSSFKSPGDDVPTNFILDRNVWCLLCPPQRPPDDLRWWAYVHALEHWFISIWGQGLK